MMHLQGGGPGGRSRRLERPEMLPKRREGRQRHRCSSGRPRTTIEAPSSERSRYSLPSATYLYCILSALLLAPRSVSPASPRSPEAEALVDHHRASRLERAEETRKRLYRWGRDGDGLSLDLRDRLDLLGDHRFAPDPELEALLVGGALLHSVAG